MGRVDPVLVSKSKISKAKVSSIYGLILRISSLICKPHNINTYIVHWHSAPSSFLSVVDIYRVWTQATKTLEIKQKKPQVTTRLSQIQSAAAADAVGNWKWPCQGLHCDASPIHRYQPWSVPNSKRLMWKATTTLELLQQQRHPYGGWHMINVLHEIFLGTWCGMHSLLIPPISMPQLPKSTPWFIVKIFVLVIII